MSCVDHQVCTDSCCRQCFLKKKKMMMMMAKQSPLYASSLYPSSDRHPFLGRQKTHPSSPNVLRQRPPSPVTASKPAPIQRPPLTPNVLSITKKKTDPESKPKEKAVEAAGHEHGAPSERDVAGAASKTKEGKRADVEGGPLVHLSPPLLSVCLSH